MMTNYVTLQASMCITAMKEAMFGDGESNLDDTDDEWERSQVSYSCNCSCNVKNSVANVK
jgi:hypothetical protein